MLTVTDEFTADVATQVLAMIDVASWEYPKGFARGQRSGLPWPIKGTFATGQATLNDLPPLP